MPVSRSCVYGRQIEFDTVPLPPPSACTGRGEPIPNQRRKQKPKKSLAAAPAPNGAHTSSTPRVLSKRKTLNAKRLNSKLTAVIYPVPLRRGTTGSPAPARHRERSEAISGRLRGSPASNDGKDAIGVSRCCMFDAFVPSVQLAAEARPQDEGPGGRMSIPPTPTRHARQRAKTNPEGCASQDIQPLGQPTLATLLRTLNGIPTDIERDLRKIYEYSSASSP